MGVGALLTNINNGRKGRNIGISTGIPKLDKIIHGIQRKYLYTIGADSGGGKTSFSLDVFVYNLIKNATVPINILFYSFEMSADALLAKVLSLYILDTFNEVVTYEDILSLEKTISDEHLAIVEKCKPWLIELSNRLTIFDKALTPAAIYITTREWLKKFGTFVQVDEYHEEYIRNDENAYYVTLFDHVGLINGLGTKKERIDNVVESMIYYRNKCWMTGIFIQQLNRNGKSMDRKTNGYELVQLDDKENKWKTINLISNHLFYISCNFTIYINIFY